MGDIMSDEGSFYQVPVTKVVSVEKHPNADRLSVYKVFDFNVIGGLDEYKVGDLVVYIPIDSILNNPDFEFFLFPADSKVKIRKSRVRQIKLRKVASQGMFVSPEKLVEAGFIKSYKEGQDLAKELKISKYEPPAPKEHVQGKQGAKKRYKEHPHFFKYNGINNIKWFPYMFEEGEPVVYQEKLHGSLFRASVLPYQADTLWRKFKKLIGLAPDFEKLYGSNNVQISRKFNYKGYYGEDVYGKCAKNFDIFSKIRPGEVCFFELIGPGIQKNYDYGLTDHKIVLYDVCLIADDGHRAWLTPGELEKYSKERGFEMVPTLFTGGFNKEEAYKHTFGPSVYCPSQKVREGIVVKSATHNYTTLDGGKKSLKYISEDYLGDKSNTDNH
jgi:RNA ligase (TIGR02306 family)